MNIPFNCPACGAAIQVTSQWVGTQAKCKQCGKVSILPPLHADGQPWTGPAMSQVNLASVAVALGLSKAQMRALRVGIAILICILFGICGVMAYKLVHQNSPAIPTAPGAVSKP